MNLRLPISLFLAAGVTFGLFWIMQALIGMEGGLDESARSRMVDFVRLKRDETSDEKKRELPKKKQIGRASCRERV